MSKINLYKTNRKYSIVYADPPWKYKAWNGVGEGLRTAENHYPCMNLVDIKSLPVARICNKDCILFLWVTFPCLKEGLELMESWGFKYKTCAFNWVKQNKKSDTLFWGLGYWTRANSEICLIGTKGHPKRESKSVHQVVISRVQQHSKKPDEVRDRIVELCGDLPRVELFARNRVPGWDCWGNEV